VLGQVLPGAVRLEGVHFEYTGPSGVTEWLGEPPDGSRGQYRTSIDAALEWRDRDDRRCLTLVEWKYTEDSFGECGGFKSKANERRDYCKNLSVIKAPSGTPEGVQAGVDCYLESGSGPTTRRHYWERLADSGIDLRLLAGRGCPFRGPLNQLMRQALVAGFLREQRVAAYVDQVVIGFEHNRSLLAVPRDLKSLQVDGRGDILAIWNAALTGVPPVRHVTVEQLMMEVDRGGGADLNWRRYLRERYGL
jgi:hypothetical protein